MCGDLVAAVAADDAAFVARLLATEIADPDGGALVFESRRGGYLTLGQARYTFVKAVSAVGGIDGFRLHDLRHTCASLAISAGQTRRWCRSCSATRLRR